MGLKMWEITHWPRNNKVTYHLSIHEGSDLSKPDSAIFEERVYISKEYLKKFKVENGMFNVYLGRSVLIKPDKEYSICIKW